MVAEEMTCFVPGTLLQALEFLVSEGLPVGALQEVGEEELAAKGSGRVGVIDEGPTGTDFPDDVQGQGLVSDLKALDDPSDDTGQLSVDDQLKG